MIKVTCLESKKRHDVKEIHSYFKNNKDSSSREYFTPGKDIKFTITAVYKGLEQIWSLIRSCFGSGFWVKSSNWSNIETWKN